MALVSGLLAALLPKCPLCLIGYLSIFGVGAGAASVAGVASAVLRPMGIGLAALTLAFMGLRFWRQARRPGRVLGGRLL